MKTFIVSSLLFRCISPPSLSVSTVTEMVTSINSSDPSDTLPGHWSLIGLEWSSDLMLSSDWSIVITWPGSDTLTGHWSFPPGLWYLLFYPVIRDLTVWTPQTFRQQNQGFYNRDVLDELLSTQCTACLHIFENRFCILHPLNCSIFSPRSTLSHPLKMLVTMQ